MSTEDRALVQRWLNERDPDAFKDIVNKYANMVYAVSKRILRNDTDAEDTTQESFLVLAKGNAKNVNSLGPWLHTVATHRALDRVRNSASRRKLELRYAEQASQTETPDWDDLQGFIDEAIMALPEDLRSVIVCHFLEHKTHGKIADDLGLSRQTVTYRQKKAIDQIRHSLKGKGIVITAAFLSSALATGLPATATATLIARLHKLALVPTAYSPVPSLASLIISKPLLLKIGAVLILAIGIAFVGLDRKPIVSDSLADAVAPKTIRSEPIATDATVNPVAEAAISVVSTSDVSGRVYDSDSDKGMAEVVVRLNRSDAKGDTLESQEIQTDVDGYYAFVNLNQGTYTLAVDATDVYVSNQDGVLARDVAITKPGTLYEEDFPLAATSILEGLVTAGPDPVRNSTITINNYFDNDHLETIRVTTDEDGRYRVTGVDDFSGILRAARMRNDGTDQEATQSHSAVTTITAGTIAIADFAFAGGGAAIEGHVYYVDESQPLRANVNSYYIKDLGSELNSNGTYSQTDQNGYYRIDNLPQGVISLQVNAQGLHSGSITNEAILREGETTVHDIVFGDTSIHCRVYNIPSDSKHVTVSVEPGFERPPENVTTLTFADAVGRTVSWSHVNHTADEPSATLKNLKPGEYTVIAFSLPTKWNVADMIAMGWDEFLPRVVSSRVYLTIDSYSDKIEVDLDFAIHETWRDAEEIR
jgi:RNA polymerase sigma factor (sigma-70 family)